MYETPFTEKYYSMPEIAYFTSYKYIHASIHNNSFYFQNNVPSLPIEEQKTYKISAQCGPHVLIWSTGGSELHVY